ncbi:MAG: UvrD-helicase domain-containing protein [Planctomycetes bacterium]|nr:UvrD-helicase domain-containing protein [Planctomycetota bacterium]
MQHPFTILDEDDQRRMFKRIWKDLDLDPKLLDPRKAQWQISTWKNQMVKPAQVQPTDEIQEVAKKAWERYAALSKEECVFDFDDLLMVPVRLMEEDEELRKKWQAKFPYVLIDEYQDTNHAQYRLIQLLGAHGNVCATGDPDQAIYGWRGADIENILRFEQDFPGCRTVLLEQNYRSSKTILRAAQAVVENNTKRKQKTIRTDNPEGALITLAAVEDEVDESLAIAAKIDRLRASGRKLADIAVFYRVNALSRILEDGLRRRGVPYRIVGGTRFYDRREVKDVLAYLRLLINPRESGSFERIANVPKRGVGDKAVQAVFDLAADEGVGFHEILMTDALIERVAVGRSAAPLNNLMRIWRMLRTLPLSNPAACVEGVITLTGLEEFYLAEGEGDEGHERVANIREVVTAAEQFKEGDPQATLEHFLDHVALVTAVDQDRAKATDQVTLMTLHAAKGLEFPVVFIAAVEQGVLPLERQGQSDYEEERRLMYVGITRAKSELYLSRAAVRMQYGKTQRNPASMFLEEIPEDCFVAKTSIRAKAGGGGEPRRATRDPDQDGDGEEEPKPRRPRIDDLGLITAAELRRQREEREAVATGKAWAEQNRLGTRSADPFRPDERVIHSVFGRGTVIGLAGPEGDRRIVIAFDQSGQKELLLAFCAGKLSKEDGPGAGGQSPAPTSTPAPDGEVPF